MNIEFRNVKGHIEVYVDKEFLFSADTVSEALRELEAEQKGAYIERV